MSGRLALEAAASAGDQIEDENAERDHEKEVNEAAGDVETESQDPQNENDYEDGPEHGVLLRPAAPQGRTPGRTLKPFELGS
jgi:hypothetical protein